MENATEQHPALYFYVWRKTNGYKPRRKHPTMDSASQEAARLASKYPESTFLILAAVAEIKASAGAESA